MDSGWTMTATPSPSRREVTAPAKKPQAVPVYVADPANGAAPAPVDRTRRSTGTRRPWRRSYEALVGRVCTGCASRASRSVQLV